MLRDKADKGLLIPFNWSTALLGDRRLRINGQHSSNMLCELNGAFPSGLKVHHDEYKVENEGDVVLLYRQLDERKSGRSVGDMPGPIREWCPSLVQCQRERRSSQPRASLGISVQWQRS
jgi:hypothetical protein